MNRDIKFRAWHKTYKKMFKIGQLTIEKGSWNYEPKDKEFIGMSISCQPDFILMQYTGLKDKNGVEIYEGDILETCENYGMAECWLRYEVKYEEQLAQFVLFPTIENGTYNNNNWNIPIYEYNEQAREIIGNIYENE